MVQAAETVELKPETLLAYATHIGRSEAAVEQMLRGDQQFLCVRRLCRTNCTAPQRHHDRGAQFW